VTRFVEAVERVAQATGATVLIIHHANKGSINAVEQNQSASRGSSALTDGVRLQMNLATMDANGAKKFGIPEEQRKVI
jgi:RecA-family ATPase